MDLRDSVSGIRQYFSPVAAHRTHAPSTVLQPICGWRSLHWVSNLLLSRIAGAQIQTQTRAASRQGIGAGLDWTEPAVPPVFLPASSTAAAKLSVLANRAAVSCPRATPAAPVRVAMSTTYCRTGTQRDTEQPHRESVVLRALCVCRAAANPHATGESKCRLHSQPVRPCGLIAPRPPPSRDRYHPTTLQPQGPGGSVKHDPAWPPRTCAPACVCAYHSASASVSRPSASVSLTSTVLPEAAVWMSLGLVARPLTMFSHAAVMKWTCRVGEGAGVVGWGRGGVR